MKIKIEYQYDGEYEARAYDETGTYLGVAISSVSYEKAKERLIEKMKKKSEVPEPEEVEI